MRQAHASVGCDHGLEALSDRAKFFADQAVLFTQERRRGHVQSASLCLWRKSFTTGVDREKQIAEAFGATSISFFFRR